MTDEPTITEDELIELLAAAEPNTLEVEDAMWAYVSAEYRHASFKDKAMKMGQLIADTAERRRAARMTILRFSSGGLVHV